MGASASSPRRRQSVPTWPADARILFEEQQDLRTAPPPPAPAARPALPRRASLSNLTAKASLVRQASASLVRQASFSSLTSLASRRAAHTPSDLAAATAHGCTECTYLGCAVDLVAMRTSSKKLHATIRWPSGKIENVDGRKLGLPTRKDASEPRMRRRASV
ncbi:hypothetical protein M885DRAFT_548926 [Pelagophyceae sp. CCMP2097]|nr:hypothetical protein M885DRAFT_548926 [Pelagophyceae sp. CCMP2097]